MLLSFFSEMDSASASVSKTAELLLTLPLLQQLRLTDVIAIQVANELDALGDVERSEAVCESLKKSMQEAEKALNKKRDKASEKDTDARKRDKEDADRKREADGAREAHETACSCLERNRETLVQLEKKVDELVAKHYRQQSIRLHPDRVGEEFRDDFELLKESAEILMQKLLRQKYVKEMYSMLRLKETGQIEPQMLSQSHKAWVASYREGRMKTGNENTQFASNRHNDANWQKQQESRQQQRQKMQQQLNNDAGAGSGNRITSVPLFEYHYPCSIIGTLIPVSVISSLIPIILSVALSRLSVALSRLPVALSRSSVALSRLSVALSRLSVAFSDYQ